MVLHSDRIGAFIRKGKDVRDLSLSAQEHRGKAV